MATKEVVKASNGKITKKQYQEMLKSFAEAGIENAFESEFEKTGKDLIKNIHQIEYGSEELSKIAIKYRKDNGITSAGRNICVVEYIEKNGENTTKTFVSNATKHSEELMIEYLKSNNISGEDVKKVFTEREPCVETYTNLGHNCTKNIMDFMPNVEVLYVVDYGVTPKDGAVAREKLKTILNFLLN